LDFEKWTAKIGDVTITEIEISTIGGLHISKTFKQARVGTVNLSLRGRSFPLFLTLAQGAKLGRPLEPLDDLKKKHFGGSADERALARAISKLKQLMVDSGIDRATVDLLIVNERDQGSEISIDD
jgi:hypothetical protein